MRIVAMHLGHNATAALAEDGRIVAALSQEKMDNVKNSAAFPGQAIEAMLSEVGWRVQDIEHVVVASNSVYAPEVYTNLFDAEGRVVDASPAVRLGKSLELALGAPGKVLMRPFRAWRHRNIVRRGEAFLRESLRRFGLDDRPVSHVEHHMCHARSAYHSFADPDDDRPALIFTADGGGDGLSATVTLVEKGRFRRIAATPHTASLGRIYSSTTRFLGMKPIEHEYKVMGLAPYAKKYFLDVYNAIFDPVIRLNGSNPLVFKSAFNTSCFYEYLAERAVGVRFDNLAAAVQHLIEDRVTAWVKAAIHITGVRRIFTGGGLFMNVKMNKRIQELDEVEEIHFMPSSGDESNAIGAAFAHFAQLGIPTRPLENVYLGISYDQDEIEKFISSRNLRSRYDICYEHDIEARIAELLASGEVVARFSGRCEWGARSLGNRAILAHPSRVESFYAVNDLIKSRDFWMPFAPSILDTAAPRYLKGYDERRVEAPYMITAFDATEIGKQHLCAAMHRGDGTVRPQVVTEQANPSYYRLLKEFEKRTGVGAVLNTSLNIHGYPLVATLEQALFTLENSGLRYLALGSYLIRKT